MIRSFEDYVDKANAAKSEDELFDVFLKTVNRHGLDRALFCIATDHNDIGVKAGPAVINNYPEDWMKYYFEQQFEKVDPVMVFGLTQLTTYRWDLIPTRMKLKQRQQLCLNLGKEAGLNDGLCTPLRGPNNQLAGVSLASSEKIDGFDGKIDLITAYTNHFYIAWKRFHTKDSPETTTNPVLTDRERDILCWAAQGKGDFEIGVILGISSGTVNWNLKNIYKKLEANDRVLAVVKAISFGLISL